MSKLVMIVDDEPGILSALSGVLSDEGYRTVCTGSGEEALELYRERQPDVVFLDIWLPDRDGLETLQALREQDRTAAVIMMSGHGTTSTAVKAIKMGACDFVEKPLSYNQVVDRVAAALEFRASVSQDSALLTSLERMKDRLETPPELSPPPEIGIVRTGDQPQRTISESTVLYGLGLHSGARTGMVMQPLPVDHGIHFLTLPGNAHIPAHIGVVAETDYATTLSRNGDSIKTVEHFLSALHAMGVTNLLVKVHGAARWKNASGRGCSSTCSQSPPSPCGARTQRKVSAGTQAAAALWPTRSNPDRCSEPGSPGADGARVNTAEYCFRRVR